MLLLRCSLPADSMSRSTSFWPSTIATRSSSAWVALNSMRFIFFSPALCHGRWAPVGPAARIDELLQKSVLECVTGRERGRFLVFFVWLRGGGGSAGALQRQIRPCDRGAWNSCVERVFRLPPLL